MELIRFLFQDFSHWLGGFFYLATISATIISFHPIKISINRNVKDKDTKPSN